MNTLIDLRSLARDLRPALPTIQDPALVPHAIATWSGRMKNEHGSARVFEALALQLDAAGVDGAAECRAFAAEERRHGVLCGAVVEALGAPALFEQEPLSFPLHPDASPSEGVLRNVLSIACLSETVAVSLIGAERLAMQPGQLRDTLETILADEIGHARFGWKLVADQIPRLSIEGRAQLTRYLAVAFAALERHQLANISPVTSPAVEAAELGVCDGHEMRALFYATVTQVIVPRLCAVGIDASGAWHARADVPGAPELAA